MAGYDYDAAFRILRWPLREALLALRHRRQYQALEEWRHAMSVWAAIAPHAAKKDRPKQPPLPAILRSPKERT